VLTVDEGPDLSVGSPAVMAEALGMGAEEAMRRRCAAAIVRRMIESFWDEEAGLFRALRNEQPIPVVTPFNLYLLWTGQLPDGIRERLLDHLTNPNMFLGEYVLPTVARNDSNYDPETIWRGPVWANINYFFIKALRQVGEHDLARTLRDKTLELIISHPGIYEYYNSQTG
jgi:glycogen debranching enzyme